MEGSAGVAAHRLHTLDVLQEECRHDPGTVLDRLLVRLQARAADVVRALGGAPLYVRVNAEWIVFTGNGHVAVLGQGPAGERRTLPDVLVQGSCRSLLSVLLGTIDARAAVRDGVLVPMVAVERVAPVLALVGEELSALADDYAKG